MLQKHSIYLLVSFFVIGLLFQGYDFGNYDTFLITLDPTDKEISKTLVS